MHKRIRQFAALALALCLTVTSAGAVSTNRNGDVIIRVGLASANSHNTTKELEAAHLQNESGYGAGYRFGYYDDDRIFVELGRTDASVTQVAVLKTTNLYYGYSSALGKYTYSSSITSSVLVGCYHIQLPGSWSYSEAVAEAARYSGGFVAWIDGEYQVRVGAYGTKEDALAAQSSMGLGGTIVGTSSYGMSVVETGTARILFQYDEGADSKLAIQPDVTGASETRTWFSGFHYRGGFQYQRRTGGNLTVVNFVELEDYINGVVCYEMGREWPLEALKAQAMCARTYVLKNLGKHESYGFDICNTANCQVYYGMGNGSSSYGPSAVSMQAVDETAGLVVKYNGSLAETFYSSSFGGASENAKYVWGTDTVNTYPYLRGVEDPYEADLDDKNPTSPWTVSYTSAQLTSQLQSKGYGSGASVQSLVLTYSELGNVIQLVVHWSNGQTNTFTPSNIRSAFGVSSIRFTVNGNTVTSGGTSSGTVSINGSAVDSVDGLYTISGSGTVSSIGDSPYVISDSGSVGQLEQQSGSGSNQGGGTVTVSGSSYLFEGGGVGHQIGMSQFGANAMARRGFTYDEIITFYFPGVSIGHY